MEDIRFKNPNNQQYNINIIWIFIKNNWIKILFLLLILSILTFPTFYGTLIGTWWSNFINAFYQKTILMLCL